MKKYLDILQEIANLKQAIKHDAENEKKIARLAIKTAYREGTDADLEKAENEFELARLMYVEEQRNNESINLAIQILTDNAKQALFAENIGTICDIWNKYAGKSHGEKTSQKIRDEIKTGTGYDVFIGNRYTNAQITIYTNFVPGSVFYSLEIVPIWNGENAPALNDSNKIQTLDAAQMRPVNCSGYVEDIDAHIEKLRQAHAAALSLQEAYEKAIDEYNSLTRGNIQTASRREGVKHYYI